ncbi:DNA cytosine methyltransferase [Infirmifilum sp.]|uniref:DNA cytosine methyltransferase n=1 Tax=Infirmifilum sp. TaxID=2856575 RepID=UPI003D0ACBD8
MGSDVSAAELFAGIGGLGLGARRAGLEVEVAVEVDCRRLEVYVRAVAPRKPLCADAREVDYAQLGGISVLIAGPPCQPYSMATPSRSRGVAHRLYGLDLEVARAAKEAYPEVVVVEEVPGWDPEPLAKILSSSGYSTRYELVDFSEYGVPIAKKRWILIASRRGDPARAFHRLSELREPPRSAAEALLGLPPDPCPEDECEWGGAKVYNHRSPKVKSRIRELFPYIPPGYSLRKAHREGLVDASKYVRDLEKKHSYWLYRIPLQGPAKAVPHPRRSMMLHPIYNRVITARELARLMTFPDRLDLRPLNLEDMYRSLADAVPPAFSEKLFAALVSTLL